MKKILETLYNNLTIMKTVLKIISLTSLILIAAIVLLNTLNTIAMESNFFSIRVNVGFLGLLCALLGGILVLSLSLLFSNSGKGKKKLEKQFENEKLNRELETEKVKQLEAKIRTLEEALKLATKK